MISFILFFQLFFNVGTELSQEEKKLYENIIQYRKEKKLYSIPLSPALTKVAQAHAKDLSENYSINEVCNPHSWSNKGNWKGCCYTSDHKAAACMWDKPKEISGYNSSGYEIAYWNSNKATAEAALESWKKSVNHHNLIINASIWQKATWKAIGIGIYGNYAVVWFGEMEDKAMSNEQ